MNRRDALKTIAVLLGGTIVGSRSFLSGRSNAEAPSVARRFTARQISLLDEVGETILPTTAESPGAKAAGIGDFMRDIVSRNYNEEERTVFLEGIDSLEALASERNGRSFRDLSPEKRHDLLMELEADDDARYYRMMKELTLWGYFSSEVGMTQALRHRPVPGRWEPCITVAPEARAWS